MRGKGVILLRLKLYPLNVENIKGLLPMHHFVPQLIIHVTHFVGRLADLVLAAAARGPASGPHRCAFAIDYDC